jgi:hypothetical protein
VTSTTTVTPTPTTYCTPGSSAVCSDSHTTIFAIAHSYNDPVNTILYRITVPAWLPGNQLRRRQERLLLSSHGDRQH